MRRIFLAICATTLQCCLSTCVAAELDRPVLQAGQISSAVSRPGAQLTTSSDGSTVALKLVDPSSELPVLTAGPGNATFTTVSYTMEAPIGKSEKRHDLVTLDGLGNATVLGISFSKFSTRWIPADPSASANRKAYCDEMRVAAKVEMAKSAAATGKTPEDIDEAANKLECSHANFAKYLPSRVADAGKAMSKPGPGGWMWGGAAKYGFQDSDYYDATSLAKVSERNNPWSLGAFVGWNPETNDSDMFILAKAERKASYKDADASVRCPAGAGTAPFNCVNGSIGKPKEKQGTTASIEIRKMLSPGYALSLTVARDWSKKATMVELPVYWLGDGSGALNGGIKAAWNREDKKTVISLFIGIPYTRWPSM